MSLTIKFGSEIRTYEGYQAKYLNTRIKNIVEIIRQTGGYVFGNYIHDVLLPCIRDHNHPLVVKSIDVIMNMRSYSLFKEALETAEFLYSQIPNDSLYGGDYKIKYYVNDYNGDKIVEINILTMQTMNYCDIDIGLVMLKPYNNNGLNMSEILNTESDKQFIFPRGFNDIKEVYDALDKKIAHIPLSSFNKLSGDKKWIAHIINDYLLREWIIQVGDSGYLEYNDLGNLIIKKEQNIKDNSSLMTRISQLLPTIQLLLDAEIDRKTVKTQLITLHQTLDSLGEEILNTKNK